MNIIKHFILFAFVIVQTTLSAHCQMPCGIYHDDMVYDQIDQYVETMFKGMTVLDELQIKTSKDRCEFVRWVVSKERQSDEAAQLILTYFLQQKIKPGEDDTVKRLVSAHKLLFLLVQIKQNVDRKFIEQFAEEWENFKLMFHVEGYECKIEKIKLEKRARLEKEKQMREQGHNHSHNGHNHSHDHNHDHDHDHEHPHSH